jgi:hypothetical protein
MTSPILVTGGTGTLGRLVVARLRDAGATSECSAATTTRASRASSSFPAIWPRTRGSKPRCRERRPSCIARAPARATRTRRDTSYAPPRAPERGILCSSRWRSRPDPDRRPHRPHDVRLLRIQARRRAGRGRLGPVMDDAARHPWSAVTCGARGKRRPIVPMPLPGKAARAVREGANLAPDRAVGRRTWEEFLAARVGALTPLG